MSNENSNNQQNNDDVAALGCLPIIFLIGFLLFNNFNYDYLIKEQGVIVVDKFSFKTEYKPFDSEISKLNKHWQLAGRYAYYGGNNEESIIIIDKFSHKAYVKYLDTEIKRKFDKNDFIKKAKAKGYTDAQIDEYMKIRGLDNDPLDIRDINVKDENKQSNGSVYPDGTIIKNKKTGEKMIMKDRKWQKMNTQENNESWAF